MPQNQQKNMINTGPSMMSKQDIAMIKAAKKKMAIKNAVNKAVNKVLAEEERKIDSKLEKLSRMNEDDLEELRAKRLEDLKKKQLQRSKWYIFPSINFQQFLTIFFCFFAFKGWRIIMVKSMRLWIKSNFLRM